MRPRRDKRTAARKAKTVAPVSRIGLSARELHVKSARCGKWRKRPENRGDRRSSRFAALGQYACGKPSRSTLGSTMLRFLYDRSIARKSDQRSRLRQRSVGSGIASRRHRDDRPHRSNRSKPATQDGRRLRRYARRWVVERFFAWVQWQRRILVRWEYYPQNFLGFVQLACLVILFRRF